MGSAVSRSEFEELQEEVEIFKESIGILSNRELLEQIEAARKRRRDGQSISFAEVEDQLRE